MEEEKEKKRENDTVFQAWLQKKREQVVEMRRVQRAKQLENMNSRVSRAALWGMVPARADSWARSLRAAGCRPRQCPGAAPAKGAPCR